MSFICTIIVIAISLRRSYPECMMNELNGRMIACQILITGLIAQQTVDELFSLMKPPSSD